MKRKFHLVFLQGSWFKVFILSALGVISSACGVYLAMLSKNVVDMVTGQISGDILRVGILLAGVILFQLGLHVAITLLHVHTAVSLRFQLQTDLFARFLHKQKVAAARFHSGELVHRLSGDTGIVAESVAEIFPSLMAISARIVFSFAALLMLDWMLAILCLIAGVVMLVAAYIYRKKTGDLFHKSRESEGVIRSFLQETAQNLSVIQAFSVHNVILRLLGKAQAESYRLTIQKNRISIGASVCLYVAMTAGYYAVLGWGAWRIFSGAITFGSFTAILGLTGDISTPFQQLASLFPQYLSFCASAERLEELDALPQEVAGEQKDPEDLHMQMTALAIRNLSFSYGDAPVLYQANADFEKGKLTAVCGKSGAGKSTLLNLILGLLQPDSGSVNAVLRDETECSLSCYRKLFAYVPQEFLLLSGTVLENITLFDEEPDMNRVNAVLHLACLEEEVEHLPDGINTQLGEGGSRLSGGQRQRMAIARALYSSADVLLMDESTSALSADSEEQILKNLRTTGKTVIFVTHRQTAIRLCDSVWRVEATSLHREN